MKNVIFASVLFTVFLSHAADNEAVFRPTVTSDVLNIAGASTIAAVKSAVAVGSCALGLKSISEICEGEVAGGLLLGGLSYLLGIIALKLVDSQEGCTAYTSAHLRPLSEGLQTTTMLFSGLASIGAVGIIAAKCLPKP